MQQQRRSINWLILLLFVLLAGISIWSVIIILRETVSHELTVFNSSEIAPAESHDRVPQESLPTLRVGGDDSNPPYSFLENGNAQGLDNDLIRRMAETLGYRVEFNLSDLSDAKQKLANGDIDVISGITNSEQTTQSMLFAAPHALITYDLFVQADSGIKSISDLQNGEIIVIRGDESQKYLNEIDFSGHIVLAKNAEEAMTWLASGLYDGALVGRIQGYYLIDKLKLRNIHATGINEFDRNYGMAVNAKDRMLYLRINQAQAVLVSSGVYEDILSYWLSQYQRQSYFARNELLIYGLLLLITAILIVVAWGWSLNRLVKRRTLELHTSEQQYRQLINNATEGVIIIVEQHLVYLNPQASSILGLTGSEAMGGIHLLDYVHPLDHEIVLIKYQQLMDNLPVNAQLTIRCLTSKGTIRWIRTSSVRIDWEGKPALLSFISDITEERKLEESIRSSEERYRLIFAQSPVGLFYYDSGLSITSVNDRFAEIMGVTREELQGFNLKLIDNSKVTDALFAVSRGEDGSHEGWIESFGSNPHSNLYIKLHTTPLVNDKLEFHGGIGLMEDLTDQIKSEHKIQSLEEKFAKIFFTSPDAINISDLGDGKFIDINRGFCEMTGFSRDEVIGKNSAEVDIWGNPADRDKLLKELLEKGECKNFEVQLKNKAGKLNDCLMSASIIEVDGNSCVLTITRDISDIKRTSELIRKSELRYRSIFESVPVSIWEQDLLALYDMLEDLRTNGVTDLMEYLNLHPEFVEQAVKSIKILDVNEASLKIYDAESKVQLLTSLDKIFNLESLDNLKRELLAIWEGKPFYSGDTVNVDLKKRPIHINLAMQIPETREGFRSVLVSVTDITQRKIAERALLESESRYRQLVEQINVVVYLDYAVIPSRPKYISPQIESLLGYTQEEWMTDPELMTRVIHPEDLQFMLDEDMRTDKTGEPFVVEYRAFHRDGHMIWVHDEAILIHDQISEHDDWHGVMYDITDRKKAEEALKRSENRYRSIFDSAPVSIKEEDFSTIGSMMAELRQAGVIDFEDYLEKHPDWVKNAASTVKINEVNQETLRIYKAESKEQMSGPLTKIFAQETYKVFEKELLAFWNRQPLFEMETVSQTVSGEKIFMWVSIVIPTDENDYSRILVTAMDITQRKEAEEQVRMQVRYLGALRAVDMAISASMDLPITLRVLINQVQQQLLVNAVSILTLDQHTQTLKYAAGIGFESNTVENTNLRLGQSYAGQAALERRIIMADDLTASNSKIFTKNFNKEAFTHYIGIPLVSKGTVKGVLELFNYGPFNQDAAWMSLLEAMAGQAAIAIENATLMDEVQKINLNLRTAYDATIEGWARSIDLGTSDSENHSKTLADLAIELAQVTGFQGEGLLNLRRGALLHDIGKLGIPDAILSKPGPLSTEEWKIMRTYPLIAKQVLGSIDFLQSAMDIPCHHHENWDGSGYPNGLAGLEIPFAARVFAVVDCWVALRSDRPWRKAWTDSNAWEFIEKQSGKKFDPQIVEKFRSLLGNGFTTYF